MADKSVKLKLTLSDGRIIESNAFTLPQGPAGPTGKDGAPGAQGAPGAVGKDGATITTCEVVEV